MASSSISFLSRRLLLSKNRPSFPLSHPRRTFTASSSHSESDSDSGSTPDVGPEPDPSPDGARQPPPNPQPYNRPLEDGLEPGIFKAILVGKVGQNPVQKRLRSGNLVTLFSLGTGGIRNNRRPLDDEKPSEYANRCSIQWHRVSVYPQSLGMLAKKSVKPGDILYLEGNIETKVFADPISGIVRRIREIAIRGQGRLVFLGKGDDDKADSYAKGVGYFG